MINGCSILKSIQSHPVNNACYSAFVVNDETFRCLTSVSSKYKVKISRKDPNTRFGLRVLFVFLFGENPQGVAYSTEPLCSSG